MAWIVDLMFAFFMYGLPSALLMIGVLLAALWRTGSLRVAVVTTVFIGGTLAAMALYVAVFVSGLNRAVALLFLAVLASGALLGAAAFWAPFVWSRRRTCVAQK